MGSPTNARSGQAPRSQDGASTSYQHRDETQKSRGRHRTCNDDDRTCSRCARGDFSPHLTSRSGSPSSVRSPLGLGGRLPEGSGDAEGDNANNVHGYLGDAVADGVLGGKTRMSTTEWLAQRHGVQHPRLIYLDYYFPFLRWVVQYKWRYLSGDLIAALTMASFYIPMSLSYASNLGHVTPVQGMYAFVFNPLVYAFLGTCPQMVVGPEAAGSLLTGNVVRDSIQRGHSRDDEAAAHATVASVVTGTAGAILLLAGVARLGFLDNVLGRPFLRGFISAIGVVILVDQLIPEMGLSRLATGVNGAQHGSSVEKLVFLFRNIKQAHALTCAVSFGSFAIIMVCR